MSARHNEDFLKTHIPEEFFDKCLLTADGRHFTTVDSLVDYLGDEKVITEITSRTGCLNFKCVVKRVKQWKGTP